MEDQIIMWAFNAGTGSVFGFLMYKMSNGSIKEMREAVTKNTEALIMLKESLKNNYDFKARR